MINSNKILFVLFCLISIPGITAQDKRYFTMREAVRLENSENNRSLLPENCRLLQWLPGGVKFAWIRQFPEETLIIRDAETGISDSSLTLTRFNAAAINYNPDLKFKSFPAFQWTDNDNIILRKNGSFLNYNLPSGAFRKIFEVSQNASAIEFAPGHNMAAFVENDNIFITGQDNNLKITNDGGKGIVYGQAVHRNEFGISKGLFWSPDGKKLAFYRMDETEVSEYFIYDNSSMPAGYKSIRYPVAGAKSHHVTIGIYNLENGTTVYLDTGEPKDQYLTNLCWGPANKYLYLAIVNRGQNQNHVARFDTETGTLDKILFEERDQKYIEPQHGFHFLEDNPDRFIWQSERDGFNHLYLYNTSGKMIRQLTSGKWVVTRLIGTDPKGETAFFEATRESPLERHIYSVSLSRGEIKKLSLEQGTNYAMFNKNYSHFLLSVSSLKIPRKISLCNSNSDQTGIILNASNPLDAFKLGETNLFPILNEGNVLYCRMITPPDFDRKKMYPVLVYVYGGPHAQMVNNTWLGGSNLWMQLMAQKGYIVFTLDNRGSANRGHEFESATYRNLGVMESADQIAGINYLKNLSFVDANRIGVHGWSYGGFMTTTLMTRFPGVFKAGVAGGPVIDWGLYEIMYTERYMDTPSENPEGYKRANLLNAVSELQDKLLMIHGCDDDVVLWQHSLMFCKAAVDAGNTYLDYFVYPGHKHNVLGPDRVHLMQKITEYLTDNL